MLAPLVWEMFLKSTSTWFRMYSSTPTFSIHYDSIDILNNSVDNYSFEYIYQFLIMLLRNVSLRVLHGHWSQIWRKFDALLILLKTNFFHLCILMIQGYPQWIRPERRLCGIYTVCYLIFMIHCLGKLVFSLTVNK